MNRTTLNEAIAEAERFLRKARAIPPDPDKPDEPGPFYGCPETAAAKRASMDLTRVLAKLRRS